MKTYVVTPYKNHLDDKVLMRGHKICFYGEIWLIIPELSLLPLLNWSIDMSVDFWMYSIPFELDADTQMCLI